MYRVIITGLEVWLTLNLAIPAFIIWQRSPHFRHQLFRWTMGGLTSPHERLHAHLLIDAARHNR
jgi:hypothetical protein